MSRAAVAWRRIRRWLQPPRKLRPTRLGWFFLAGVFLLGVAAVNTGNNLLYFVLGMFLAAIVVSGILSERNLRGLRVTRSSVGLATAGEPATLALSIERDARRLPALALVAHDHDPDTGAVGADVRFARIDPSSGRRRLYACVFPVRGIHRLTEVEVGTAYPFALFRKSRRFEVISEVRVRPRVPEVDLPGARGGREEGAAAQPRRGEGLDLFGLRDHSAGDDARRIHWKASARTGRVVVKDPAREEPPQVVLRLPLSDWPDAVSFERAVERTAGLAAALLREGFAAGLLAGATRIEPSAQPSVLDAILDALVDVRPSAVRIDDEPSPPPGAALLVIGRDAAASPARSDADATTIAGRPAPRERARAGEERRA